MRDHALANCVVCNTACEAWMCIGCAFVGDYYIARFKDDNRSAPPRKLARYSQTALARDVDRDHIAAIQSASVDLRDEVPDYHQPHHRRVRRLRRDHCDAWITAAQRERMSTLYQLLFPGSLFNAFPGAES